MRSYVSLREPHPLQGTQKRPSIIPPLVNIRQLGLLISEQPQSSLVLDLYQPRPLPSRQIERPIARLGLARAVFQFLEGGRITRAAGEGRDAVVGSEDGRRSIDRIGRRHLGGLLLSILVIVAAQALLDEHIHQFPLLRRNALQIRPDERFIDAERSPPDHFLHRAPHHASAAAQPQHQVQRGIVPDVVIVDRLPVLELLPAEDNTLLLGGDSLLLGDLRLDVLDGLALLDFDGDRLAGEGFDEELHAAAQVEGGRQRRGWSDEGAAAAADEGDATAGARLAQQEGGCH
mmetsp:Transcript_22294/g.54011  ORF Transcript_22294/g.54011 Transcript_22294/m.54011 type:complete len:289 (+) Transcript_22294:270-1136(+)